MPTPQRGILPVASSHAIFLTLRRRLGRRGDPALRTLLGHVPERIETLAAGNKDAAISAVLAIGSDCWQEIFETGRPAALRPFPRIAGAIHPAPATDGDLLLHIRGERYDLIFEFADHLAVQLGDWFEVVESISGFRYRDKRDLTGFVDGTENPEGDDNRIAAAVVGEEDAEWAGGSYLHVQRYVHRLEQWTKLPVKQQEAIMGRTKAHNEEMDDEHKPRTSHIARVVIEENGEELEMLRHSLPYGTPAGDRGLLFASYGRTPDVFEKMLTRMVAPTFDGRVDHMLNYTRAVTGTAYFAPSREKLVGLMSGK
ncbi:putative iron-dependent peroxidase [Silvimonas terrae]|uniref:Putative iron-dependent peroxidase n=1 Tax=Silvimonas terrae TaxID=300266 RepID=A0A840REX6_9NEIS|nr:Dyp-type peroxidase [Silvimonas terrae]MBB5191885.1 putative iron-dependent peroxidase [Silvimonas terrae]